MSYFHEPMDWYDRLEHVRVLKEAVRDRDITESQFIYKMARLGFTATDIEAELQDAKKLG